MNNIKGILFTVFTIALFFCSCQNPGESPEKTPEPTLDPTPGTKPPAVTGVQASCLQYTDRIHITWNQAEGAESYKVYRYLHKSPEDPQVFANSANVFEDTDASADTPYFYRVVSVIGSEISDLSANYVKGIYSPVIDSYEPNDDKSQAGEVSGGEPAQPNAVVYSFTEGEAQDSDWYKYTGAYTLLNIKVLLPPGSPFTGELSLHIENGASITLVEGENTLGYSGSDLYFTIEFIVPDPDIDTTGTYTVFLELIA